MTSCAVHTTYGLVWSAPYFKQLRQGSHFALCKTLLPIFYNNSFNSSLPHLYKKKVCFAIPRSTYKIITPSHFAVIPGPKEVSTYKFLEHKFTFVTGHHSNSSSFRVFGKVAYISCNLHSLRITHFHHQNVSL